MVCVYCKNDTKVYNSRHLCRTNGTWRRRTCNICSSSFTTLELPDYSSLWSVLSSKTNNDLEPFNRNKILISLHKSLGHQKTALEDAENLTNTIVARLHSLIRDGLVSSDHISEIISDVLKNFDKVALTYYQAYYCK